MDAPLRTPSTKWYQNGSASYEFLFENAFERKRPQSHEHQTPKTDTVEKKPRNERFRESETPTAARYANLRAPFENETGNENVFTHELA